VAKSSGQEPPRATVPTRFAETNPPLPSGDYSYTVELVSTMNHQLGKLTEAVDSLKDQSRSHGQEIREISRDIHTFKVTATIVGAILAAAIAFAGWAINKGVDAYVQTYHPDRTVHQAIVKSPSRPARTSNCGSSLRDLPFRVVPFCLLEDVLRMTANGCVKTKQVGSASIRGSAQNDGNLMEHLSAVTNPACVALVWKFRIEA
jgi:hypothetical protein